MAKTVFKYPLKSPLSTVEIEMPEGAEILSLQVQRGEPTIWALVDPDAPKTTRKFETFGTGWDIEFDSPGIKFIGTYQVDGGQYVFHVFEHLRN